MLYNFGFAVAGILLFIAAYLMLAVKAPTVAASIIVTGFGYGAILTGALCFIAQFAIWVYLLWTRGH